MTDYLKGFAAAAQDAKPDNYSQCLVAWRAWRTSYCLTSWSQGYRDGLAVAFGR